jgi:hypothetical protein
MLHGYIWHLTSDAVLAIGTVQARKFVLTYLAVGEIAITANSYFGIKLPGWFCPNFAYHFKVTNNWPTRLDPLLNLAKLHTVSIRAHEFVRMCLFRLGTSCLWRFIIVALLASPQQKLHSLLLRRHPQSRPVHQLLQQDPPPVTQTTVQHQDQVTAILSCCMGLLESLLLRNSRKASYRCQQLCTPHQR